MSALLKYIVRRRGKQAGADPNVPSLEGRDSTKSGRAKECFRVEQAFWNAQVQSQLVFFQHWRIPRRVTWGNSKAREVKGGEGEPHASLPNLGHNGQAEEGKRAWGGLSSLPPLPPPA